MKSEPAVSSVVGIIDGIVVGTVVGMVAGTVVGIVVGTVVSILVETVVAGVGVEVVSVVSFTISLAGVAAGVVLVESGLTHPLNRTIPVTSTVKILIAFHFFIARASNSRYMMCTASDTYQ
jgi:hypothetical protein